MNFDNVIAVRDKKTIYRDGELCIKVFNEEYSKADVLNEALNQARVEETGLKIPNIYEVLTVDGKWAIVSRYIKGKTLQTLMDENPDKKDEYLSLFVDIQLEIHSKKNPLLNKLKDKMSRKISMADIDANTRYDLLTRLESMAKHDKLCHGDYNPSNVIITDEGEAYVLDWAHATQGNASADAARTYLLFWLSGDFASAKKYLELFSEKSHTEKRYIERWMPVVACSQSVKGNEKEREFLLSWAQVVDFD